MRVERDATDLGLSWRSLDESEGDVLVAARPTPPPVGAETVEAVGSTAAGRRAAWRIAGLREPSRRVPRVQCEDCFAQPGHWCKARRGGRIVEVPGRLCGGEHSRKG